MDIGRLYHKIVLTSPKIEVVLRCFYWNNVSWLRKYRSQSAIAESANTTQGQGADFNKVTDFLIRHGVSKKDIIIVHSSYEALSGTGLSAEEVVNQLYSIVDGGGL